MRTAIAWHMALLPILGLIVFKRDAPVKYWLVAFAFASSWFADWVASALSGSWSVLHFLPSIQLGLFAYAFGSVLVPAALFSMTLIPPYDAPDVLVTVVGSIAVLYLSMGDDLAPAMLAYAGVASALYIVLVMTMASERFMWFWPPYQAARLVSFGLFTRAVCHADVR